MRDSRRNGVNSQKRKALEQIREKRKSNSQLNQSRIVDEYDATEELVYKTVTEDEYGEIVKQRREETPFVVNDDAALGYYDDGEEYYFEENDEQEEEQLVDQETEQKGLQSSGALSKNYIKRIKQHQRAKLGGNGERKVSSFFLSRSSRPSVGPHDESTMSKEIKDVDGLDLNSMLNDLTSDPLGKKNSSSSSSFLTGKRRKMATKYSKFAMRMDDTSNPISSSRNDPLVHSVVKDNDIEKRHEETTDHHLQSHHLEDNMEEEDAIKQESVPKNTNRKLHIDQIPVEETNQQEKDSPEIQSISKISTVENILEQEDDLPEIKSNEVDSWWVAAEKKVTPPSSSSEMESTSVPMDVNVESLSMYWTDAIEVRDRPGKLYLVGKTKVLNSSDENPRYQSCCVLVNNVPRYLYVVPRQPKDKPPIEEMNGDERTALWTEMHAELGRILPCNRNFQSTLVKRNYAFELADLPRGISTYLKVKYSSKYGPPSEVQCEKGGFSFSRICGMDIRPLETFIIRRKLMGPSWISIHLPQFCTSRVDSFSYCKVEVQVENPKDVKRLDGLAAPPLSVMSLSLKTVANPQNHHHEVVAISAIVQQNVNCEGGVNSNEKISHFTAIRPLHNHGFPTSYVEAASRDKRFSQCDTLKIEMNERALLNYFMSRVQQEDPDVLVAHNLHLYTLDVLLSRIDFFKLSGQWSKLTRMRRGRLPPLKCGDGWNEYRLDDISNGRLLCDTYVAAKELLGSQPNYSLSYLVETQLGKPRQEMQSQDIFPLMHSSPEGFMSVCRHTSDDAMFVLHLMHKLEVLPLSKQLACLCGYLWNRTLMANKRAERIEFLLLHEFDKSGKKFLVPDKLQAKRAHTASASKKEASYAGGMVFAPKKGLYDNFVVLLDFMSLYPSIIREYNICFTTVERQLKNKEDADVTNTDDNSKEMEIPEVPSSASEEGVLPGVIKRLLESRKQVKQELKRQASLGFQEKVKRLDIRQKAIKLTANSMYGCLGFKFSRFYAKPIAALITHTGRQTLQRAKDVAEQECGYDVIYGDTDSIMVDSRTSNLEEAKRIGREIQLKCNKKFKLLELEVDNIFKTILLLNKKKYAAIVVHENGEGKISFDKEVKGLDLVRRDWCALSKEVGNKVLDFILSGCRREQVVDKIHVYLHEFSLQLRSVDSFPLESYIITKALNKQPEDYPDSMKQYHVQVGLAMKSQGKAVGVGTHVPYVICNEMEESTKRIAYHPDEIERSKGSLTINLDWYLESQIHPPLHRLCAHIEGTSSPQLAECLGLDSSKFHQSHGNAMDPGDDHLDKIAGTLQDDAERYKDCQPVQLVCRSCKKESIFPGVFQLSDQQGKRHSGLVCPCCSSELWGYSEMGFQHFMSILSNRLMLDVRKLLRQYYEGWVVCTDVTCNYRTQQVSLRSTLGNSCLAPGCRGTVRMETSDAFVYTQLSYFQNLFNVQKATSSHVKGKKSENHFLSDIHMNIYHDLYRAMTEILARNEYNWIRPSTWKSLFRT